MLDARKLFPHVKAFVDFSVSLDANRHRTGTQNLLIASNVSVQGLADEDNAELGRNESVGLSESPRRIGDEPSQIQTAAVVLRRERIIRGNLADTNRGCSALRERGHLAGVSCKRRKTQAVAVARKHERCWCSTLLISFS